MRGASQSIRSKSPLGRAISNQLRSDTTAAQQILGIHRALMSNQHEALREIPRRVLKDAFEVPDQNFTIPLDISGAHLNQIEKLSSGVTELVSQNYLKLVVSYIIENADRIKTMVQLDERASGIAFKGETSGVRDLIAALSPADRQCLQAMKLYAGIHSISDEIIRDYLTANLPSQWMRERLLYPLMFYVIHAPQEHSLDHLLDHYFPSSGIGVGEKILARFLLQPENPATANLALRCYVGLLSHPYDALEYVLPEIERILVEGGHAREKICEIIEPLAAALPFHRISKLYDFSTKGRLSVEKSPTVLTGISWTDSSEVENALLTVMDLGATQPPAISNSTPLLASLIGIRFSRYPEPLHFEEIDAFRRRFSMLAAGRLANFIATSLFLFMRETAQIEKLAILNGLIICGGWTHLAIGAPRGESLFRSGSFPPESSVEKAIEAVDVELAPFAEERDDRAWINAVNWNLREDQSGGRVKALAKKARASFPIHVQPRYLSGLDWAWLSHIIDALGMKALIGNGDLIYVLFLRQLEEFRRESVPLRIAFEPVAKSAGSCDSLFAWLKSELRSDSLAFIRFFLNADTILKLRLADNYVAAVSLRLELFSLAVEEYGFKEGVFNQDDLAKEQGSLTSMLCRMSVGARQFEIDWNRITISADERNRETFSTYETVKSTLSKEMGAESKRTQPYQFSNGATQDYASLARDWPLVVTIGGIIDTFLSHPSTGIEAILSVRIRHDAFRREYETAINKLERDTVTGVSPHRARQIISEISPAIYREIQRWLDLHMHLWRKEKSGAFFNFVPSKAEMTALLEDCQGADFDDVISITLNWIKPKLDEQLARARESLASELGSQLERRITQASHEMDPNNRSKGEIKRVSDALVAAMTRRTSELEEWFAIPEAEREDSLTFEELMNAVRQRFYIAHSQGLLRWGKISDDLAERAIGPTQIRLLYDLMSEAIQNARKHSGSESTKIRISSVGAKTSRVMMISNKMSEGEIKDTRIEGHPFQSLDENVFKERKSGLQKIAHMAASIASRQLEIRAVCRKGFFHLFVPLEAVGSTDQE